MKIKFQILILVTLFVIAYSCNNRKNENAVTDTITTGSTSVLVDETLKPIIEDQIAVFENAYNAKINLIPKSEKEAIVDLTENKANVIVLSRKLTSQEELFIQQKNKVTPKQTAFAKDAIALIKSNKTKDTIVSLEDIVNFVKGNISPIKGLVFDNPNSSSVRQICELADIKQIPEKLFFSFKTNDEVIKYVSENDGFIGVIGVNWIFQPSTETIKNIEKITVLHVKGNKNNNYYFPSQENITTGNYPLARDLYIINCQGYEGLGMGFSSFIAGERGQRIILKSGLVPVRFPGRNVIIKN